MRKDPSLENYENSLNAFVKKAKNNPQIKYL